MQPFTFGRNTQAHRTAGKTSFSLTLSREPPGSVKLSGTKSFSEEYNRLPFPQFKIKILDHLQHLIYKGRTKSSKARRMYKLTSPGKLDMHAGSLKAT